MSRTYPFICSFWSRKVGASGNLREELVCIHTIFFSFHQFDGLHPIFLIPDDLTTFFFLTDDLILFSNQATRQVFLLSIPYWLLTLYFFRLLEQVSEKLVISYLFLLILNLPQGLSTIEKNEKFFYYPKFNPGSKNT